MDNLPINNYGLLYSPGECYSREEAIEIIKENFFNPQPVEEQEEENIQVCCPSYEGKYPKIPISLFDEVSENIDLSNFSMHRKYRFDPVSENISSSNFLMHRKPRFVDSMKFPKISTFRIFDTSKFL